MAAPDGFQAVATEAELAQNRLMVVEAGGRRLALVYSNFRAYALDNACTHLGGPLGRGTLKGQTVVCPLHHWSYNFITGRVAEGVADEKVRTYEAKIEDGRVYVKVPPDGSPE
ncbi:MAG TPA: Rieske (2Fe-2S) protein [bacterium]|nr:Rieske (2Fe-2S) protein [bacterium]